MASLRWVNVLWLMSDGHSVTYPYVMTNRVAEEKATGAPSVLLRTNDVIRMNAARQNDNCARSNSLLNVVGGVFVRDA